MTTPHQKIIPVLISGGSGKRLWPLSRAEHPKQMLKLYNDKSLLQNTVQNCQKHSILSAPVIICNQKQRHTIASQLSEIGIKPECILLEPEARNTAPAIAVATLYVQQKYGDACLLVLPVDHKMDEIEDFLALLPHASKACETGNIVTFGIQPTHPNTQYGYIEVKPALDQSVLPVQRFVEKPNAALAKTFIDQGNYFWNAGIFLFHTKTMIKEFETHQPDILKACNESLDKSVTRGEIISLPKDAYQRNPAISIDYAIMEKTTAISMVPLKTNWNDIGNWESLYDIKSKDENGNASHGQTLLFDTKNSFVYSDHRLVMTLGLEDCYVVETRDAVLVANKNALPKLSSIVETLIEQKQVEVLSPATVCRPWGSYVAIESSPYFQIKKITVNPHQSLSLQSHQFRSEHWVVLKGKALITLGEEQHHLNPNESIFVPLGVKHRLQNLQDEPLEIIEVQMGSYLGEDDIKRYDDVYQRETVENI